MQDELTAHRRGLLSDIERAATAASRFIRERATSRGAIEWRVKSPADFVSDVDTGAERIIRDILGAAHPDARILGEELSPGAHTDAPLLFVVDPLDGTTNFLHGYPEYAVSVAALVEGVIEVGVIANVASGECFTALRDGGAFRDRASIRVSTIREPERALLGTGFPFKDHALVPAYLRQFDLVMRATSGIRRAVSAALDLADVACGRFDAFWELVLAPWDFAAGLLLVREAGGVITTVDGGEVPIARSSILAGNPDMHAWLLEILRAADVPEPHARAEHASAWRRGHGP